MKRTHDYLDDEEEQALDQVEGESLENYFSSDDDWDHAMVRALDRSEQVGGALGPLFRFNMVPAGRRRRWRDTVDHTQFHAVLEQQREARPSDDLGVHLMEALYTAIRGQIAADARPHDQMHFSIQAHGFTHAFRSVNLQVQDFLDRDQYVEELLDTLAGKLNSNEEFHPDQGLQVDMVLVRMPTPGSGRGRKRNVGERSLYEDSKRKKAIIPIDNKDELCCARAIVTMRAWVHREERPRFDSPIHPGRDWCNCRDGLPRQGDLARELHRDAGVPEGPCGIPEVAKFQEFLTPHYQIKVVNRMKHFGVIYRGPDAPHILYLLKSNDHYEGCTTMTGFVNRSYWCDVCDKGFDHNNAQKHPCDGRTCRSCDRKPPEPCPDYNRLAKPTLICPACHLSFFGPNCLEHHRRTCGKTKKCLACRAVYKVDRKHPHKCGVAECYCCHQFVDIRTHRCYIQPPYEPPPPKQTNGEPTTPPPKLVYADIECLVTEENGFVPNLLCYRAQDQTEITVHRGEECVDVFLRDLNDLARPPREDIEEQPLIIIFHNLKGFDGMFMLHALYKDMRHVEEQLSVGAKVLSFKSGPLTFKDSLCFLPMPLANFPATFGLTEMKKGFFPHLFNTPDHQTYVGPIPDLHYFDPDGMSPTKKAELMTWHAEQVVDQAQRGWQYDLQAELEEYCRSDVDILQAGCEKFTEEFEKEAGFNPFAECYTIASACNRYWRKKHLVPNTIAVEPPQGWRGARVNQSWTALQWLAYRQSLTPHVIQHVRNGGERRLITDKGPVYVDGFEEASNTVYEFMGCLWHGCPDCCQYKRWRQYGANPDRTLDELYEATCEKLKSLQRAGFNLIVEWECHWEKKVKATPDLQTFLNTMTMVPPLQPRDAFFGGRTGAVALYHRATQGEKIFYIDVTSLYPWVNKTKTYPLGHPEIHFEPEDQDLSHYFGIALVTILPPRGLFHPVLPVREGGKLTFPLCGACVKEEQAKDMFDRRAHCPHSDRERQLRGTWCTPELEEAVKRGYRLLHIHEVWHFRQTQTGLFADYVNTWLKLKQESAGWPRGCQTDEQKEAYKQAYWEQENIRLEHVAKNPGRKQVAKLMLNSFWGKFGERSNKSKVEQVIHPQHLYRILTDSANEVQSVRICTDDVLEVQYKQTEDNDMPSDRTNIFVAAFTTCWARLTLYEHLHTLQQQVLYYDTDSVIYSWKEGQPWIPTGNFLGEMTDELDGDTITEFVSGGAKNYGYRTAGGQVCCKVRGFTLNVRGRAALNYDSMRAHILDTLTQEEPADAIPVVNPHHFKRDQTNKKMKKGPLTKQYRLVFDKRVVDGTHSLPFGYH